MDEKHTSDDTLWAPTIDGKYAIVDGIIESRHIRLFANKPDAVNFAMVRGRCGADRAGARAVVARPIEPGPAHG